MNARVIEMEQAKGWGKAQLEDGRVLTFDVSVCREGVPVVGAAVLVELGPSRLGGEKLTRLSIQPSWEPVTLPFLFLGLSDPLTADVAFVHGEHFHRNAEPLALAVGSLQVGDVGLLVLEQKRGAVGFTETRVVNFRAAETAAGHRVELLRRFEAAVREAHDAWEHPDGCHCAQHRKDLERDVSLGLTLGLDLKACLTIRDYADEGPGSAYEELRPVQHRRVTVTRGRS